MEKNRTKKQKVVLDIFVGSSCNKCSLIIKALTKIKDDKVDKFFLVGFF
jgi:hypothetical protein